MKLMIKHSLSRFGILPTLDLLRRMPMIVGWIQAGCTGNAPPPVKRMVLSAYLRKYNLNQFVETGTYLGDTLAYIAARKSVHATSIELDSKFFQNAKKRFASYSNVTVLHGDSGKLLPEMVKQLTKPALFWLDGHYSGGGTGKSDLDTPVSAELAAILDSPVKGHVILIDDARCFDGTQDYPYLDNLLETVRRNGKYDVEISADIIRLTPRS